MQVFWVISACVSCFLPRKDQPQRYLHCLDLLLNKVPLDAIDAWFDLILFVFFQSLGYPTNTLECLHTFWSDVESLQGTNISVTNRHFWRWWFSGFPVWVGYVKFLGGYFQSSLKRTASSPLKMDDWKTTRSFWVSAHVHGLWLLVSANLGYEKWYVCLKKKYGAWPSTPSK